MSDELNELISEVETVRPLYSVPLSRKPLCGFCAATDSGLIELREGKKNVGAKEYNAFLMVHSFQITSHTIKKQFGSKNRSRRHFSFEQVFYITIIYILKKNQ